jgi:hypothetical protein
MLCCAVADSMLCSMPTLAHSFLCDAADLLCLFLQGISLLGICKINKLPPGIGPDPHMGMLLAFGGYNGKHATHCGRGA